jgi:hypothetical protein
MFWLGCLTLSFTLKGKSGRPIGLLNILQGLVGLTTGANLLYISTMLGLVVVFTSVGCLVGRWIYES